MMIDPRSTPILKPDAAALAKAAEILRAGGLVAFPTETVYGLGADATNGEAVARIYVAKGRPRFNPLIAHVRDSNTAKQHGQFNAEAELLAKAFWPGPLTLVVPKTTPCAISELATAGLESVALRVPAHPVARALLEAFGQPIAAPSANRSGHVSPTTAAHVASDLLGFIDLILDGGGTQVGVESTIVACLDDLRILRPGGITTEAIAAVLGWRPQSALPHHAAHPIAPGLLEQHYAPTARVRLDAREVAMGEAWLGFGPHEPASLGKARAKANLSLSQDLTEAAANLFGMLRALDETGAATIAVAPIPANGLGEAIRDRLIRAASGR